jgi:hypothetical protein
MHSKDGEVRDVMLIILEQWVAKEATARGRVEESRERRAESGDERAEEMFPTFSVSEAWSRPSVIRRSGPL